MFIIAKCDLSKTVFLRSSLLVFFLLFLFTDEQIDEETLLLLDEKSLEAMIPKIGLRLKFKKHLRELLVSEEMHI